MTHRSTVLLAMLACAGGAAAQTDPFYLTDGDGHRNYIVQNGAVQTVFNAVPNERAFGIAVAGGDIRTYGYQGETGGGYDLLGASNGNIYPFGVGSVIADGSTNGVDTNFAISFQGQVYEYDRNWANGVSTFNATDFGAITWDPTDDTLWLARDRDAGISHYKRDGTLLGSFNTVGNLDWNLGYEPSTDTLWVSQAFDGANTTLYNYGKDGTLIQSFDVPGLQAASFFGGEFDMSPIPAPGAAALLGVGGLAAARRRRA